jgi:hypothetical protein
MNAMTDGFLAGERRREKGEEKQKLSSSSLLPHGIITTKADRANRRHSNH